MCDDSERSLFREKDRKPHLSKKGFTSPVLAEPDSANTLHLFVEYWKVIVKRINCLHTRDLAWHKRCVRYSTKAQSVPVMRRSRARERAKQPPAGTQREASDMTILDLTKATVTCGGSAFVIYSFPVVGQVLIIGCLTLLWLAYARKTIAGFHRRS